MASANLDYTVEEVEVSDPEQDGVVQAAEIDDETGAVVVEGGRLPLITITGGFLLVADPRLQTDQEGQSCSGSGGYSDFGNGMNVTVRDGTGSIIASTSTVDAQWVSIDGVGGLWCRTSFETTAEIVDFYAIPVGRRGELSCSFDELKDRDHHVELTLGR